MLRRLVRDDAILIHVRRAIAMWVLVRLALAAVAIWGDAPDLARTPNALLVATLCGALAVIDVRRRGERALWANLGIRTSTFVLVYSAIALAGELVARIVLT